MNDKYVDFDIVTELVGREAFMKPAERRYRNVNIDEFGTVRIQSLNEKEWAEFEMSAVASKGGIIRKRVEDARRRLIALCVVDESGNRLLSNADVPSLENLDGSVAAHLFDVCQKHCGFEDNEIEDLVKNSDRIPDDVLPTA